MAYKNTPFEFEKFFYCKLFGHNLTLHRKITSHFEEFECTSCKKQFTVDLNGAIVSLTPLLKDINEALFLKNSKRNNFKRDL